MLTPSWPTIIKYAVGPSSLLFVTWCSASKHWRGRKREKRGSSWSLKTL